MQQPIRSGLSWATFATMMEARRSQAIVEGAPPQRKQQLPDARRDVAALPLDPLDL